MRASEDADSAEGAPSSSKSSSSKSGSVGVKRRVGTSAASKGIVHTSKAKRASYAPAPSPLSACAHQQRQRKW